MKRKLLYDLPSVLFREYLATLEVKEIKNLQLQYRDWAPKPCLYAKLPSTQYENPCLVLFDKRGDDRDSFNSVELYLLSNLPRFISDDLIEIPVPIVGVIEAKCTSSSDIKELAGYIGSQHWVSAGAILPQGYMSFSFKYSKCSNEHFAELIKRGQQLFCSKEHEWINSYFNTNEGYIPLQVNCVNAETLVFVPNL